MRVFVGIYANLESILSWVMLTCEDNPYGITFLFGGFSRKVFLQMKWVFRVPIIYYYIHYISFLNIKKD